MRVFLLLLLATLPLQARILTIGPGSYTFESAANAAVPGDTLLFMDGVHQGGSYISNLQGTAESWIVVMGRPGSQARIAGGGSAMQLTDPAYVRIENLVFEGQTANGVNIDDGGSYATPAHHLIIDGCVFRDMNATGNNDLLKMSGVDDFVVRACTFLNGSAGGSMIDMVGCHSGVFENNSFTNGGSNSIQAKGGTSDILITRNRFINGGQRAINIGGSTGLEYFRPLNANYEAARIRVYANVFRGGQTPFAYVGAVNCDVANNTVLYPDKWVMRILQETTQSQFLQCGDNLFRNNIVVVDNRAISPSVNIGGNTRPETFSFANNLWYNSETPSWQGPTLPSTETGGMNRLNPMLRDIAANDVNLQFGSPAIGAGVVISGLVFDLNGSRYNARPSIGAVEGDPATTSIASPVPLPQTRVDIFPQPAHDQAQIIIAGRATDNDVAEVSDLSGRILAHVTLVADGQGALRGVIQAQRFLPGLYIIRLASNPFATAMVIVTR